jgi:hypothetical protein
MRACAIAVVIVCALSQSACGKSVEADVVAAALEHFTARSDTMPYNEGGITLVAPQTSQWAPGFGRSNPTCAIPQLLEDRLIARNAAKQSAAPFVATSKSWRLMRPDDLKDQFLVDRTATGEPIATIVHLHAPAFSDTRDEALVIFHFRWAIHSAIAQYLLSATDNGWRVQCSDLFFYV